MSDDQLSWDLLFQTPKAEPPAAEPQAKSPKAQPEATPQTKPEAKAEVQEPPFSLQATAGAADQAATSAAASEKTTAKSRKRTSTEAKPKSESRAGTKTQTQSNESDMLSKKNWGKLEFPQANSASTDSKSAPETTVTKVTSMTTAAKVSIAPVPAPPAGLWPDDDPEDLFADHEDETQKASTEPQIITVSELNKHIRDLLEGRFPLLWLKGEISNFKAHTSGHFYFSLKDAKAQVSAVMFRGFNTQLRFRPEDGMEVIVRGKVTVYEPRGNYQIFCELMEPVGAGALQKAFEQLKAKLQKEGLFDEARKRPLPALPKHIAIVTSPTGAAIRDMLNVLGRRFKGVNITVIPCKVQGDQAPGEIVQAIGLANRLPDVDVMIVGRGGGSIEDLWAFNDERVARAIASARVPVISAVGHEVDFTIADFVADLRAPTPSAAAELVVKNAADLTDRVAGLARALKLAALRRINFARQAATSLSKRLVDPQRRLQDAAIRCDELLQRLEAGMARALQSRRIALPGLDTRLRVGVRNAILHKREVLNKNMAVLDSLSPLKVLDRGYSMVIAENGDVVTDAQTLSNGQKVTVRMCKGSIEAQVTQVKDKR